MDIVEVLQKLGFSEYESKAYIALLQRNPVNGATVAKLSSVPRANVYAVLSKLEERGAVVRVETEGGITYAPIPPEKLFQHLEDQYEETLQSARGLLLPAAATVDDSYVQNLEGQKLIFQHARAVLNAASKELLVAIWLEEAETFAHTTVKAQARGVAFTTLCMQGCPQECGFCRSRVYRYPISARSETRWFVIVSDHTEMLLGTINGKHAVGVRTRQPRLVEVAGGYIRQSIAFATLVHALGSELGHTLSPETKALLNSIEPGAGWLNDLLPLLKNGNSS